MNAAAPERPQFTAGHKRPTLTVWLPRRGRRVFIFFSFAVLLTGLVSMLFADLLWRSGWSASRTFLLVLFILLFFFSAIGCMNGLYGFILRRLGDGRRITRLADYRN